MRLLAAVLLALSAAVLGRGAEERLPDTLVWMPMGDSITHGSSTHKAIAYACAAGSRAAAHNVSKEIAERIAALPEPPTDEELTELIGHHGQRPVETAAENR